MSESRMGNITGMLSNPRSRNVILVSVGIFIVILLVVLFRAKSAARSDNAIGGANIAQPTNVQEDPTRTNVNPRYAGLVKENDRDRAQEAERTGSSVMPTIITSVQKQDMIPPPAADPSPSQPPRRILADPEPNKGYSPYTPPPTVQPTAMDQKRSEAVAAQMAGLLKGWSTPSQQKVVMVESAAPVASTANMGGNPSTSVGARPSNAKPVIQAGKLMFGTIDRMVNSDEPGPVTATIQSGPLKGAVLLGEFRREDTSLMIGFRNMSLPDGTKTVAINAYAVSQETDGYGVQTAVNNRYLERYGMLAGAALLRGVSDAYSRAGATVTSTASGSIVTYGEVEKQQIIAQGLGEVGRAVAGAMASNFTRSPTVKVASGTAIGVLFVADVYMTEGNANEPPTYTVNFGGNPAAGSQAPRAMTGYQTGSSMPPTTPPAGMGPSPGMVPGYPTLINSTQR